MEELKISKVALTPELNDVLKPMKQMIEEYRIIQKSDLPEDI